VVDPRKESTQYAANPARTHWCTSSGFKAARAGISTTSSLTAPTAEGRFAAHPLRNFIDLREGLRGVWSSEMAKAFKDLVG